MTKRYQNGRIAALNGLDIDVADGEFVAICGPSGCGKTTLLNLVAGIDRPDDGELTVLGECVGGLTESQSDRFRGRVIGLVFQLHNLLPHLTAAENVQVAMMSQEVTRWQRVQRTMTLLDRVGLSARAGALPPTLSGGERQRVAIARALANQPKLLLADEPTGALDSHTGSAVLDLLLELQRDLGMTLVVVTHEHDVANRAQRIIHIRDGRCVDG